MRNEGRIFIEMMVEQERAGEGGEEEKEGGRRARGRKGGQDEGPIRENKRKRKDRGKRLRGRRRTGG